jgi:hypothetical protein
MAQRRRRPGFLGAEAALQAWEAACDGRPLDSQVQDAMDAGPPEGDDADPEDWAAAVLGTYYGPLGIWIARLLSQRARVRAQGALPEGEIHVADDPDLEVCLRVYAVAADQDWGRDQVDSALVGWYCAWDSEVMGELFPRWRQQMDAPGHHLVGATG